ncbi:ATP-binding protein [Bradyrhizobium liaoningense]|uniref:ATP-binding protein n=1 Tax=Bradyrhizobium liaoningense TaxID=43992 RepID=UPI001BADBFE5|nr:ATP-binding protein [Bradyrhizobium liaoningense]MBR0820229.1 ATP-binding protein [Bradyrhizobium liaoningense]
MTPRPSIVPAAVAQLRAELDWLDALIHRETLRLRAAYQLSLDEFRGLYISDEQVDALVREASDGTSDLTQLDLVAQQLRVDRASFTEAMSPFVRLSREFELTRVEQDILLAVAAPEIEFKYETLYAYLNNDVTRKAPTLGLLERLFGRDAASRLDVRAALRANATLLTSRLLHTIGPDPAGTMHAALKIHPALPGYLLALGYADGSDLIEHRPREGLLRTAALDDLVRARLRTTCRAWTRGSETAPIWLLHGRDAMLREAAAATLCGMLDLDLLTLDAAALPRHHEENAATLRDALLRQRLTDAGLLLSGVEQLSDSEGRLTNDARMILRLVRQTRRPVILDCETPGPLAEALRGAHVISIGISDLDRRGRVVTWSTALCARQLAAGPAAVEHVADSFGLLTEQIDRAAQALADHRDDAEPVSAAELAAAARAASDQSIARMAQRMPQPFTWSDLVLPPSTIRRLRDIVHAIRDRQLVFGDWGLAQRAGGFGLRLLFSGPSGTGKTMAAATIARELGLDIFRVDISQTVSKYIGETEKNLDKIFHAAAHSNAILFFDEADALFGKRSEVKDAHDRYSNIETAFLLQRIEEYAGVVFLASNLSRNMDTAFSRRLNFVVDFPLPDRDARERLWRLMLANGIPIAGDVDVAFLAAQFPLSGGEIRNVTLDAAFFAAQSEQRCVGMKAIVVALARELMKQGRAPSPAEFKQHHTLIADSL